MAAPTTEEKPTIVLVRGSFQTPLVYEPLVERLKFLGYPTVQPPLPSCTNVDDPAFPSTTLIDDALAGHCCGSDAFLGGLVGSEAIPEEFTYTNRKARGLLGGVIHLYYFSAFILATGQSVLDAFGESPNNDIKPDGRFGILNGASVLYNDQPESEAALWESRLILQSYNVQKTKLTSAAYKYIPSTYLICENDQAAPTQYQEMFAASANTQVDRCSSGHSPMLSQTALLADKIAAVAKNAMHEDVNKGI